MMKIAFINKMNFIPQEINRGKFLDERHLDPLQKDNKFNNGMAYVDKAIYDIKEIKTTKVHGNIFS